MIAAVTFCAVVVIVAEPIVSSNASTLPSSVVIRVANAPSAARAVVASDVIKVVFASSASPARVTSAAKLLVNNNSAARAVVASVLIAVVLEVTVVTMLPSADWNAATISVNESNAAPSVFSSINAIEVSLAPTRFDNASSAARAVVASDSIAVVFASSAIPARRISASKLVVKVNSAARAVVASVVIAFKLAAMSVAFVAILVV